MEHNPRACRAARCGPFGVDAADGFYYHQFSQLKSAAEKESKANIEIASNSGRDEREVQS